MEERSEGKARAREKTRVIMETTTRESFTNPDIQVGMWVRRRLNPNYSVGFT